MSFFREEGTIIGRKYKIANKIGSGSFGVVYKGINIRSNEYVAIKIESLIGKSKLLKNEAKICRHLTPSKGISQVRYYGVDQENSYVVFDLLGVSLDTYMERSMDRWMDIPIRKYVTFHCDIDELRTYPLGEYFPHRNHQEPTHQLQ